MCDSCGWEKALERAEALVDDERFDFARATLVGIARWIKENRHATERMLAALGNIGRARE